MGTISDEYSYICSQTLHELNYLNIETHDEHSYRFLACATGIGRCIGHGVVFFHGHDVRR